MGVDTVHFWTWLIPTHEDALVDNNVFSVFSPSELSYEDTYNTLKYADRAKNIRLNVSAYVRI